MELITVGIMEDQTPQEDSGEKEHLQHHHNLAVSEYIGIDAGFLGGLAQLPWYRCNKTDSVDHVPTVEQLMPQVRHQCIMTVLNARQHAYAMFASFALSASPRNPIFHKQNVTIRYSTTCSRSWKMPSQWDTQRAVQAKMMRKSDWSVKKKNKRYQLLAQDHVRPVPASIVMTMPTPHLIAAVFADNLQAITMADAVHNDLSDMRKTAHL